MVLVASQLSIDAAWGHAGIARSEPYILLFEYMNLSNMADTAPKVCALMRVLSNERRLMILCLLVEGEKSVGQLCRQLALHQAALSQQLSLLRKDGLVSSRREGQSVYYTLARSDVAKLMGFLHATYCEPGDTSREER